MVKRASCPSSLFHTWETFLQEIEADVVGFSNAATSLERSVAVPLVEKTFHMKVQARKLFAHREGCEVILGKADDQLNKSRQEYRAAFLNYCDNSSPVNLATYYDSHNNYVQQLTATNAMIEQYHKHTLPTILQELEEILTDVTTAVSDAICQEGEIISEKCNHQLRRYESLCAQARAVSSTADLAHLARTLLNNQPPMRTPKRAFLPPYPPEPDDPPIDVPAETMPPVLRGEMLLDRMGGGQARLNYEQLRKDAIDLEMQIKQLQESLESLIRLQNRSIETSIYSKANEIQEEISIKKYDYRATQLHLAAVRAQSSKHNLIEMAGEACRFVFNEICLLFVVSSVYFIERDPKLKGAKIMKQVSAKKNSLKYDDENVRYKLNTQYFNNITKSKLNNDDDDSIRYKLAPVPKTKASNKKPKKKPTIKVNFWSNKLILQKTKRTTKNSLKHRHTIDVTDSVEPNKPTNPVVKIRKHVSFLPSPIFTEDHVPMVTVPDDLTIQLNTTKNQSIGKLNLDNVQNEKDINKLHEQSRKKSRSSTTQTSPRSPKGPNNDSQTIWGNENELDFFSKYVVQKLRRMETNQRIYSENLINTVLMLGQLGKLNVKSHIGET
ncbi:unnamed protein product [Leptosia nina]|uniref:Uncharacterized protein n=1 Tax=Leptosia nina TaxID=320188 RepID=A0AAV1JWN9_9NEOP